MSDKVQRLIEVLPDGNSIESLGNLIDTIRNVLEIRHVAYLAPSLGDPYAIGSTAPASATGTLARGVGSWWRQGRTIAAGTYPQEWGVHYADSGFTRVDPNLDQAMRSFIPLNWKDLDWSSPLRRRMLNEAITAGLGNQGYTVPIHGPNQQSAIFCINDYATDEEWARFIDAYRNDLILMAHYFHQKVLEVEKLYGDPPPMRLSAREQDVLTGIALGRSRGQVAHDLQISENTLRVYLDSARHKLNALNVSHAVAIAVKKSIIHI